MRSVLAVLAGVATGALGALVLGEFQFTGGLPLVAGPLFGLAVAEVVRSVAGVAHWWLAAAAAAVAAGGLAWAAAISSGCPRCPFPTGGWVAMGLGALGALAWLAPGVARLRGPR